MKAKFASVVTALLLALSATTSQAETCYALTSDNRLLSFDSSSPGVILTGPTAISGIDPAYSVVGIDFRTTVQTINPQNAGVGSLWGLAYNGTQFFLCVINPTTAAATQVGGILNLNDDALADAFGFGFDSATDRFRFISVQTNYAIDPNTATFVQQTSFPGFPAHSGAAFTTTSFGGSNRFYNISRQMSPRTLQTTDDIAAGVLTPVVPGGMGMDVNAPIGLDIEGSLFLLANSDDTSLYSVNAQTGTKTLIGMIGGGAPGFRGLAIRPNSFPPTLPVTLKVKGGKKVIAKSSRVTIRGTASSEAGISEVKYTIGNSTKKAKGTTKWSAKVRVKRGTSKISFVATGGNQIESKPVKVKVVRK